MAEKDNNIGLKVTTDIVDLKSGIKNIKNEISTADKEFQKATAGMDKWSTSTEGLEAKLTQLNTKLDSQKKSVQLYQDEIERVSQLEGDHSVQLEQLKSKLESAEIAVSKTEREIRHYSGSLEDVAKKEKEAESELGKLIQTISDQESELKDLQEEYKNVVITYGKNSTEAKELKKEINNLSNELDDNKDTVKFAEKQLELLDSQFDETADSAEQFSKGLDGIKGLGATVAGGLATIGASVGALAGSFLATAEGTREFRTNMGKLESGFETSGLKAEQARDLYKELYSVVADEGKATEASAMIGQLAKSQEDLNKWVNISTGVYATFGDSLPIENLAEASNETAKTGQLTGGLADALNWCGISEEQFQKKLDACTTEQERQKLITDTLNETYDEASQKYQQVNEDVIESNKSQVELTETMAQLGEKAEPILTAIKDGFNTLLQEVLKLTEGVDFNAFAEKIKGGFAYFVDTIVPAIKEGFQWILDNKDVLIAGIVAIGTAMLAWNVVSIVDGMVKSINAWKKATEGMTLAQKALNLAQKANVIGIIITAIVALVSAFVVLWNKSDAFREFWINLWEKIKTVTSDVIGKVKDFFSKLLTDIKNIWSGVSSWFSDVATNISNAFKNIPTKIKEFFSNAWNNVKTAWSTVSTFFTDIKDKVVTAFEELPEKMLTVGEDLVKGLWDGVKNKTDWVIKKLKSFGDDVLGGIKKFFGIASPSKEMAKIGKFLDEGLAQGIEKNIPIVTKATDKLNNEVTSSVKNIKEQMADLQLADELAVLKKAENPFKGWTFEKLNKEFTGLKNSFDLTNHKIAEMIEQYGTVENITGEDAEAFKFLTNESYRLGDSIKSLLERKIELYDQGYGTEAGAKWTQEEKAYTEQVLAIVNKYQDSRLSAEDELSKQMAQEEKERAENAKKSAEDAIKATEEAIKNNPINSTVNSFEKAMGLDEESIDNWSKRAGMALNKLASYAESAFSKVGEFTGGIFDLFQQATEEQCKAFDAELEAFNATKDTELKTFLATKKAEMETVQAQFNQGIINEEQLNAKKIQIETETKTREEQTAIEKEAKERENLKKKNELLKKQFNAQKVNDVAQATIQGALAIVKGFAELGPIGGAINAGVQAGITATQIALIAKQKFVPMLAKGGIVDSPTFAMIGENGKEAVMPLENNTGWITELARKLSEIMDRDFTFGMNQGQLAYAGAPVVNNYNNYQQTINSPHIPSRKEIYRDTKNLLTLRR